jgi:hypothetical protein
MFVYVIILTFSPLIFECVIKVEALFSYRFFHFDYFPYYVSRDQILTSAILIALIMEAVNTFETSVNFYETTCGSIPKDSFYSWSVCFRRTHYTSMSLVQHILTVCTEYTVTLTLHAFLSELNNFYYRNRNVSMLCFPCVWILLSSGGRLHVGGSKLLWNVGKYLPHSR